MTDKRVWFAAAGSSSSETNAIWPIGRHKEDFESAGLDAPAKLEKLEQSKQLMRDLNGGKLFEPHEWGVQWSPRTNAKPKKLQEFNSFGGGIYVVTDKLKAFLETHDIGEVRFHPIEVLNTKRTAPLWPGAELFHMNVGTVKRALNFQATRKSAYGLLGTLPDGASFYSARATGSDDVYTFDPSVLSGPQLWIDDTLQGALFVSDQLATALKAEKLDQGWQLKRCGISTSH